LQYEDTESGEIVASFDPLEKALCKRLQIVNIPGKRNRIVPVLLTPDMKQSIDTLLKVRCSIGVNSANPYVFAKASDSMQAVRGWACLRACASRIELERPELITSTKLRKYVATLSQLMDLKSNELDWLARHLGHDINVHREFYRLQHSSLELAKVSRMLIAVDEGNATEFAGKSLHEIKLDDIFEPNSQSGSESDDEPNEPTLAVESPSSEKTSSNKSNSCRILYTDSIQNLSIQQTGPLVIQYPLTKEKTKQTNYEHNATDKRGKTRARRGGTGLFDNAPVADENKEPDTSDDDHAVKRRRPSKSQKKGHIDVMSSDLLSFKEKASCSNDTIPLRLQAHKCNKVPWSSAEKSAIFSSLRLYILQSRVPGKEACVDAISKSNGNLNSRSWRQVKYCVKNIIDSSQKLKNKTVS